MSRAFQAGRRFLCCISAVRLAFNSVILCNTRRNTRDSPQRFPSICRLITVRNALRGEGHRTLFPWRRVLRFMRYTIEIEGRRLVSAHNASEQSRRQCAETRRSVRYRGGSCAADRRLFCAAIFARRSTRRRARYASSHTGFARVFSTHGAVLRLHDPHDGARLHRRA